jgi:hypothetical protein
MREDDVQVPESELLDDSALEGITGGVGSGGGAGTVSDVASHTLNITKFTPPPPPPPPFQDG